MTRSGTTYLVALTGVAVVAGLTFVLLPVLGLASSALLFLIPVLFAAAKGGLGPGLTAALLGAGAYNFFLLPPRLSFRIHGLDNLVSVFVLVAVAVVTSRLATRLRDRENEALERARMSEEIASLSAVLTNDRSNSPLQAGLELLAQWHDSLRLLPMSSLPEQDAAFSSLDLSAAAWAMHHGDSTGHSTPILPAADWTFIPLAPIGQKDGLLAALARPTNGATRPPGELEHVRQLCRLLAQCNDRQALEKERRDREILETSDKLRHAFLASLAHDFRTPLTVISGRLEILSRQTPEARDALLAARRLDRTMKDLLGAARIESGFLAPKLESIDLVDAVEAACIDALKPPSITLARTIPADIPFVAGDPVLLHHVLTNLLDNALNHARGHVILSAEALLHSVRLCFADDGPGIPLAERQKIFERFTRLEGSDRNRGSGLGLAIVRGFCDAMQIPIDVGVSGLGGASFTLELPIARRMPA